ncbi:MAG: PilZ domain-containing protein [Blastocatellia bacterium]
MVATQALTATKFWPSQTAMMANSSSGLLPEYNTRKQTRLKLRLTLFARRLTNSLAYGRKVETINISSQGLLITSNLALEVGTIIELTSATRSVRANAVVRHCSYDTNTHKWLIGLALTEKLSSWFVVQH